MIKDLAGNSVSTASWDNGGKPMIVSFWATWCKPCVQELNNIADYYEEWQEKYGVKLIAVSIDDARNLAKVRSFVSGRKWSYEIYLDPNNDLQRALNVTNVPHTFLLDGEKRIVWQHTAYLPGDEEELAHQIQKLIAETPSESNRE
jgi:thiol-disulfide isomerase/thioredoxin